MKFLFKTLLILLVILFSLKLVIYFFNKGHKVSYTIGNFNIVETHTSKDNNYYFEIKHEDFSINFQVFKNGKKEKIIDNIKYFDEGSYKCILPIFKGKNILTDIMCLKGDTITYYQNLNNKKIDEFAETLKKYGYDKNNYIDKSKGTKLSNTKTIYNSNILDNHYLAMETYTGVNLFNSKNKTVKLFNDDVYKRPISIFTDKYYIVADYNEKYAFKKFFVVNIINGNLKEIRSYEEISFDSIMQGAVKDDIYLFDKDSETQYKISLKHETVEKVATKDNIKYYNGKWGTMTLKEAISGKTFDNYLSKENPDYDKVIKVNKYYYFYKKQDNGYDIYRADTQDEKIKTYIFTTTNIDSIIYINDYIYYKNGTSFYYYYNGSKKIITNTELEFNNDIYLGVYIK